MMATYTFKTGKKASSPIWSWSFLIGKTKKLNRIDFTFNISSSFILSAEQIEALGDRKKEWLKVGGITWYRGLFGWLFNRNDKEAILIAFRHRIPGEENIEITPYVNNNYDWENGSIGKVKPDKDYHGYIERLSPGDYRIVILSEWPDRLESRFQVDEDKFIEVLPPWHGGRTPAQHEKTLKFAFDLN